MNDRVQQDWRSNEISMIDACLRAGMTSAQCVSMFPGRTPGGIKAKFRDRRVKLGIYVSVGRPVSPDSESWEPIDPSYSLNAFENMARAGSTLLFNATVSMFHRAAHRNNISLEQAGRRMLAPISAAAMEAAA